MGVPLDLIFGDDFGEAPPPPPPPPPPSTCRPRNMVAFDPLMYTDEVRVVRVRRYDSGGHEVTAYDNEPSVVHCANVRSRQIDRTDPATGRISLATIWMVRTPVNLFIEPDDLFLFNEDGDIRHLVAEGRSVPKAQGNSYLTECTERT